MAPEMHPDDEFHEPTTDDPEWTETCWFTFTVPERGLSGQLYPYFKKNQGVAAGGAFFWDGRHERPETCVYAKQFWHLPLADDARLTDLALANGISYRCLEPQKQWAIRYDDPDDGDEIHVDLTVTGVVPPNMLGESHVDQACRYQGTIVLHGEEITVDSYGFRDRSWGPRPQYGQGIHGGGSHRGGYSYATASDRDAFHAITMDFGTGCIAIHGYVLRGGEWAKVKSRHPRGGGARRARIPGAGRPRSRRRAGSGGPCRGPPAQLDRLPHQPEPVHHQRAHRVDLRRRDRLGRGPRQPQLPGRSPPVP